MKKRKSKTRSNAGKRPASPGGKLPCDVYERELERLQVQLCHLQTWVRHERARAVVVFEGRDAAGKGGVIKRITEKVSPRIFRTVALPAPSDREQTQLHIQRYLAHFPAAGEVVLFDRSWYNRAGVERVMGFCRPDEYKQFLAEAPRFEKYVVDQGIIFVKYFFEVSQEEQEKRFLARARDPLRHWKLSPMDVESWRRWWDYTEAYADMVEATDTKWAPWYRVDADDKRRARLNCIAHLLSRFPYEELPFIPPDPGRRKSKPKGAPERLSFTHDVPALY